MLILGLLLVLGSAALGVGLVYDGSEAASVEILGTTVDTTAAGLFFSGAATMLVFLVGVWLLSSTMGRARRKRTERKVARKEQRASVEKLERERTQLAAENERLSEQLDTSSAARDGSTSTTTSRDTSTTRNGSTVANDGSTVTNDGSTVANDASTAPREVDVRDAPATTPSTGKHT